MLKIFTLSLKYFAIVFITGFVLGTVRVLFVLDLLGERCAELIEMPIMIAVTVLAAKYLVNKYKPYLSLRSSFAMGMIALIILLTFEFTLVLALRNMSVHEYIASRDPVSGSAYVISLVLYAVMPMLAFRFKNR